MFNQGMLKHYVNTLYYMYIEIFNLRFVCFCSRLNVSTFSLEFSVVVVFVVVADDDDVVVNDYDDVCHMTHTCTDCVCY